MKWEWVVPGVCLALSLVHLVAARRTPGNGAEVRVPSAGHAYSALSWALVGGLEAADVLGTHLPGRPILLGIVILTLALGPLAEWGRDRRNLSEPTSPTPPVR